MDPAGTRPGSVGKCDTLNSARIGTPKQLRCFRVAAVNHGVPRGDADRRLIQENALVTVACFLECRTGMPRVTKVTWTDEQIALLKDLVRKGASASRAAVALRRPRAQVMAKAREIGVPFPSLREVKARQRAIEKTVER